MKSILILTSLTGIVATALAGALAVQDDWAREPGRGRWRDARLPVPAHRPARRAAGAA